MKTLAVLVILLLVSPVAQAASIRLYTDPGAGGDVLHIGAQEVATIYVFAHSDAADPIGGFVDAGEFRIVGLPTEWAASATQDPAMNVAIGNAVSDGVTFAWPTAQFGTIPLFSILLVATTEEEDVLLQVVQHVNPSTHFGGQVLQCPWLHFFCAGPCDISGFCVDGGVLSVNPRGLPVEGTSWSRVRTLYK